MILLVTPGSAKASQSDSWVGSSPMVWYLYMAKDEHQLLTNTSPILLSTGILSLLFQTASTDFFFDPRAISLMLCSTSISNLPSPVPVWRRVISPNNQLPGNLLTGTTHDDSFHRTFSRIDDGWLCISTFSHTFFSKEVWKSGHLYFLGPSLRTSARE
jgi:hypothetical protein